MYTQDFQIPTLGIPGFFSRRGQFKFKSCIIALQTPAYSSEPLNDFGSVVCYKPFKALRLFAYSKLFKNGLFMTHAFAHA